MEAAVAKGGPFGSDAMKRAEQQLMQMPYPLLSPVGRWLVDNPPRQPLAFPSREQHAEFVRSLDADDDLATT